MAKHTLTFYSNRRTPRVHITGKKPGTAKKSWGKRTSSRPANAREEKQLAKRPGAWIRVNEKGQRPSDSSYKSKASMRPWLDKKGKKRK